MPKTIIHIGANKTGSTTLQRRLFSKTGRLVYLGEDGENYKVYKDTLNSLISDDDIYFCYQDAIELFNSSKLAAGERTLLLSSEDIMTSRVPSLCAKRLHELLPDAHILLVIRNQLTAIPSWYANHGAYLKMVPRRYWRRYVSFDDWIGYGMEFRKYSPLDSYFYHRILMLYAFLFGKEKIHILFYEDFVNAPKQFISRLSAILEIDADEAVRLLQGKRERRRNTMREFRYHQFCSYAGGRDLSEHLPAACRGLWKNFLARGSPADAFMSDYWRHQVIKLYQDDNLKLMNDYNINLRDYGYPLPEAE